MGTPTVRRVVTGETRNGKAVMASDTLVPGVRFYLLWGANCLPSLPNVGTEAPFADWFPPEGDFHVEFIVLPPRGCARIRR
jgi:hypothetical protein